MNQATFERPDGLEQRLDDLSSELRGMKRQLYRWKLGAVAGLAVALLGAAAASNVQEKVEAKEFVLRDSQGGLRGLLAVRPDGTPGLSLFDDQNNLRLSLDLGSGGTPSVNLHDPSGVVRSRSGRPREWDTGSGHVRHRRCLAGLD